MEATSNGRRKLSIRRKRRMTSRVMSNRYARGRVRPRIERKQHKVSQLIDESVNDDNTTTSENSESNALYNEIDWEGNVECDTSLVDEFAPRMPLTFGTYTITDDISTLLNIPDPPKIEESSEGHEFRQGVEIYVRRHSADIWCVATIMEVDWDEHEVLIHYKDESSNIPDEWVPMNSQRLSRTRPSDIEEHYLKNEDISKERSREIKPQFEDLEKVKIKQEPIDDEDEAVESIIKYHKPPTPRPRQRGGWKRKRANIPLSNISYRNSKFAEGEQVLAKWSDHRMQKFPAVIKTTYGDGRYDVLFYDGFEKTINEEHLFKTTAEEVAKYQQANPSEADTFVDMDADSKEARRQRKRKTFDDYVFAKEIKMTKRRGLKGERFGLAKKLSSYAKVSESKDSSDLDKPLLRKKMRRRRRALFVPKRDNTRKLHMTDYVHESNVRKQYIDAQDNEHFYGFDSSQGEENSTEASEPTQDVEEPPTVDVRWKPGAALDLKPINITGNDGLVYKSVVVPDSNLPEGWLKHAVLKPGNVWEIFLLSPDGFQIANEAELKHYGTLPSGGLPPAGLDFLADFSLLPKLMNQQNELPVAGTPKIWLRRKSVRGGRRGGRGHGHFSSGPGKSIGRVRTLLPKHKGETPSLVVSPPPQQTPTASESELWKCPKEECDKKFRKESLLQMHIKHYHSELSSLVRSVPNMVDLACARSESVNSDWTPTLDVPKGSQTSVKRILPRPYCSSPTGSTDAVDAESITDVTIPSVQSTSRIFERNIPDTLSAKRHHIHDERRTTIKTIFPIRTSSDIPTKSNLDSDDVESDDEYIEQKKNGSRIFKAGKYRRNGKSTTGSICDENSGDSSFAHLSTFKFTKGRKYSEKLQSSIDNYDSYTEEEKTSPMNEVTEDGVVIERLKSEEFINCACGFREEDGLMIQCDICTCWQHGHCTGIESEADVPERYVCAICRNPFKVRSSKKYAYAQHYLTQGKLPTFSLRSRNDEDITQREIIIKRSFELKSCIQEIRNVDRSLSAKINIIEQPDHPKLYMWAKNWEDLEKNSNKSPSGPDENSLDNSNADKGLSGPEPETPIDLEECRLRLLNDIESGYSQLEDRLTSLQTQVAALESLDPDDLSHPASDKALKQSIQVLLRDLTMVKKLATINCQADSQL